MHDAERYLLRGDAAAIPLRDGSVHCIVTSPPYWSLRKYSGAQDRDWPAGEYAPMPGLPPFAVPEWTGPLGLEPTPELYIWHLLCCFAECWRVLRDDGVLWCIIGDSYSSGHKIPGRNDIENMYGNAPAIAKGKSELEPQPQCAVCGRFMKFDLIAQEWLCNHSPKLLSAGDLVGVPARLQFALQGAGWIIRNDVVYAKKNCMPESVAGWRYEKRDGGYVLRRGSWRHTRSQETILMCVKKMQYFSDQERVRESAVKGASGSRFDNGKSAIHQLDRAQEGYRESAGRNPRSVLTVASEPWHGDHYAAYPTALIAPLIRATCPTRCCPECGAGWAPVVERGNQSNAFGAGGGPKAEFSEFQRLTTGIGRMDGGRRAIEGSTFNNNPTKRPPPPPVLGYRPTCDCGLDDSVPGIVLDCFCGSGTTLAVCRELGVRGIGLDLSHSYLDDQAKIRGAVSAPSRALENLPLFEGME